MNSRLNLAGPQVTAAVAADARGALWHNRGACKWMALSAALVAALAMAPGASAQGRYGHSGYRGGHSGHYVQPRYYNGGGYYRGGHWSGGRWIAGAIVTGAVIGLINDVVAPRPVYYAPPVVYGPPPVVYQNYPAPVVRGQVVASPGVVYGDPYQTRYIRSDW